MTQAKLCENAALTIAKHLAPAINQYIKSLGHVLELLETMDSKIEAMLKKAVMVKKAPKMAEKFFKSF